MEMRRLDGRVILVTGSGRGFGRAMAHAYALEGAQVVAASRTASELEDLEVSVGARGGSVTTMITDLARVEEIRRLRDEVLDRFGRLDVLVNNAATSPWKTLEEMTVDDWDRTLDVNLRAPFLLSKAFLGTMKAEGRGSVINVTSRSAEMGFVAEVGYCPSKYGIEGLTQCLALELQPHNIAVNTLGVSAPPGLRLKPTEMTLEEARRMPEEVSRLYADDDSMVEAFSEAWAFLALQDAARVTGQRIGTRELADYLKMNGWDSAVSRWGRKLTKAVYVPYDFPESARYQTPDGGFKELVFRFPKPRVTPR